MDNQKSIRPHGSLGYNSVLAIAFLLVFVASCLQLSHSASFLRRAAGFALIVACCCRMLPKSWDARFGLVKS